MIKVIPGPDNERVYNLIADIKENSQEGIRKAFYFVGRDLRTTAQQLIADKNKSGRNYLTRIGRIRREHQASAPGEPPANLTGALRKSIGFEVRGSDQLEFGSRGVKYAEDLETGTSRIEPRPYLKPAITKNEGNTKQHFEREIEKELTK